uniref:Uncharacterized protein n=1 Tax=Glossina pallidipes TaxID=7398 RepID=A0A1A9Z9H4_GLOPL
MIKKFLQIVIFAFYWLCFTPWLFIWAYKRRILNTSPLTMLLIRGTALFFILIIIYWIIHSIFDDCYMRAKIRRKIREVTIRQRLEALENGDIELEAAQRLSTFTRIERPSTKDRRNTKEQEHKLSEDETENLQKAASTATSKPSAPPPPYSAVKPWLVNPWSGFLYTANMKHLCHRSSLH